MGRAKGNGGARKAGIRAASVHRNEFLNAFARLDFARVHISARISGGDMQPEQWPAGAAQVADPASHGAIAPVQNPDHVVHDVRNEDVALLAIRRKAHGANRAALERVVGDEKFLYELALFGEDLNAVAPAVDDVN